MSKALNVTTLKGTTTSKKGPNPLDDKRLRALTDKEERELKLAFELYDLTGCGVITREDALNILSTLGYKATREDNLKLNAIL